MDPHTEALARAIGARVRRERRARGWTLDRLAELAGVSRRLVVNVEQGAANPSIATLLRLGDALGVGLPALVERPAPRPVRITRSGEGAVLWTGPAGGRGVLVSATEAPDVVELWDWVLGPGDRHPSEPHAAGTRELLQVRDGHLTVEIAEESVLLAAGDALTFAADVAHTYTNAGDAPVTFTMTVFEPAIGAAVHKEKRHG